MFIYLVVHQHYEKSGKACPFDVTRDLWVFASRVQAYRHIAIMRLELAKNGYLWRKKCFYVPATYRDALLYSLERRVFGKNPNLVIRLYRIAVIGGESPINDAISAAESFNQLFGV